MVLTVRSLLVLLLLAGPARASAPKVTVTLVVDQLAGWIADERWPLLPADGGFARLRREGTWVHAATYDHAVTDTGPGHAAIYTGAPPRESGIWANEFIDLDQLDKPSAMRDPSTRLIASDGPRDLPGSSLRALRVPTLADQLRAAQPNAVIVTLSLKERAGMFGGGRKPTASIWFDASVGRFVTSTAFASAFPPWAIKSAGPDTLRKLRDKVWEPLSQAWVAHAATADDQAGESDMPGWGVTFPHRLDTAHDPGRAFRASPFADEVLLTLGLDAVDALRTDEAPMLLAISLSSNDYVGHLWGPDSLESWDELRRLDAALAHFFDGLDARVGAGNWAAVLTGDHGVTTLPEAISPKTRPWCTQKKPDPWQRPCGPVWRVVPDELQPKLEAAAQRAVGEGRWIAGIADPYVYLTRAARALEGERAAKLRAAVVDTLKAEPPVAQVLDAQKVPASCPTGDSVDALACRSLVVGAPGDYYVLLKPGSFFDPDYVVGFGTSHGSAYLYDRAVPILARWPGHIPAGRTVPKATIGTFSRTASAILGISPPPAAAKKGTDLSHPR
jgi:hypothetical protein